MKTKKTTNIDKDFFAKLWDESWIYIKTIVDVVREPVLILDKNLCVMAANAPFYKTFHVDKNDTEGKVVYELGNGQWNIPALRELLEKILPDDTFFNGFEVTHIFPSIGRKVMLLNARQIHCQADSTSKYIPPIILLAFEDITEMIHIAELLSKKVTQSGETYKNE